MTLHRLVPEKQYGAILNFELSQQTHDVACLQPVPPREELSEAASMARRLAGTSLGPGTLREEDAALDYETRFITPLTTDLSLPPIEMKRP